MTLSRCYYLVSAYKCEIFTPTKGSQTFGGLQKPSNFNIEKSTPRGDRIKGLKLRRFHPYLGSAAVDERLPHLLRLVYCGSYIKIMWEGQLVDPPIHYLTCAIVP